MTTTSPASNRHIYQSNGNIQTFNELEKDYVIKSKEEQRLAHQRSVNDIMRKRN